jgi:hypothetical protein
MTKNMASDSLWGLLSIVQSGYRATSIGLYEVSPSEHMMKKFLIPKASTSTLSLKHLQLDNSKWFYDPKNLKNKKIFFQSQMELLSRLDPLL